ncbi:MAG: O-antigen ligase family protein [Pirellulales bacterium]
MARAILDPATLPILGRRWDLVTLGLLAALLAFMPAAFGAVEAWSEMIVVAGATLLALVLALRTAFDKDFRPLQTWTYLPLALFLALVTLQLLPLPHGLADWLSPHTVATKSELLGGATPPATTTLSFYPRATVENLRMVLAGTAVFVTVASVFRRQRQIMELLLVIFIIGCAEAALNIAQMASGTQQIYGMFPTGAQHLRSGSFVNYSHYCQFMNLSLGAGVALLLVQLHELGRHEAHASFSRQVLTRINWEKHGLIFGGIMLSAITVFTSMSRNGVISLLVASAVIGALLYRRGTLNWRGWMLGVLPLGVLLGLLLFGFDIAYERLATLRDSGAIENRWQMMLAALRAWREFPIWGTGLGTHEVVFPMFEDSVTPYLAVHADNDYAQLLEETGLAGAVLVGLFVGGIATLAMRLMLRGRTAAAAAAFGLALGLLAVAIHSATDFGQRIPANFMLTATFCGLLVSIARIEARDRLVRHGKAEPLSPGRPAIRRGVAVASLVALLLVGGWALKDSYAAFLGERWYAAAITMDNYIQKSPTQADDQDYVDLLTAADSAARSDPTNVTYAYWLNVYRWQSLSRSVDPNTPQLALPPDAIPFVERIAADLDLVRRLCPTFGPPYALEGQLRLFVLQEMRGADLIRTGLRLAAYDPATCFVAGELAAREGKFTEAESLLSRAIQLSPGLYRDVVRLCLTDVKRPDLARKLAGDDYRRLQALATGAGQDPEYADLVEELHAEATASLRRHAEDHNVRPDELAALASIDQRQGDFQSAAALYRRALALQYNRVDWRISLAQTLAAAGQFDEAIHEVRICLRLRPEHPQAKSLLNQWITRRKTQ